MEYKVGDRVVVQYCKFMDEPYDCPIDKTQREFTEYETTIVGCNFDTDNCYYILFDAGWDIRDVSEDITDCVEPEYHNSNLWSIHPSNIIRKIGVENKKESQGCNCIDCNTYYPMAENNYKHGDKEVLLCFVCRSDYMWKWRSLVKI